MENDFELNGEKYQMLKPVQDFVLCEVIDQEAVQRSKSGLYLATEVGVVENKLRVLDIGSQFPTTIPIAVGDYIETADMSRIQWVKGPHREKLAMIASKNIAGFYRKA